MFRPSTAPTVQRLISQMNNDEPLFTLTRRRVADDVALGVLNPHQGIPPSRFRERDMYQTTYSFIHRPFARDEQVETGAYWQKEKNTRPWLQVRLK